MVDTSAEDLTEYLSSLQQTYRETVHAENSGRTETIAHISGAADNIKPAVVKRPARRGLEKDNEPLRKKPVKRKRAEKEDKVKETARKK